MQIPSELETLLSESQAIGTCSAVEIGTAQGMSICLLAQVVRPGGRVVSVELPEDRGGYPPWRRELFRSIVPADRELVLIQGDSQQEETRDSVRAALAGSPADLLVIDGDHEYDAVKRDFHLYGPEVRVGGLIALHDICPGAVERVGGVPRFWGEIKGSFRWREVIADRRQGGYGYGLLWLAEPLARVPGRSDDLSGLGVRSSGG